LGRSPERARYFQGKFVLVIPITYRCHPDQHTSIVQETQTTLLWQTKDVSTTLLMTQVPRTEESARH
jgi:hypothetical protein